MDVDHHFGHGQQGAGKIVGNDLGNRALSVSRKHSVHVTAIDPGSTLSSLKGGIVHRWHHDHPATDLIGTQRVGHTPECNRTFVLIAVIGAGQNCCRTATVLDHRYRHHDGAPGGIVPRIRHFQKSVLYPVLFEIHR